MGHRHPGVHGAADSAHSVTSPRARTPSLPTRLTGSLPPQTAVSAAGTEDGRPPHGPEWSLWLLAWTLLCPCLMLSWGVWQRQTQGPCAGRPGGEGQELDRRRFWDRDRIWCLSARAFPPALSRQQSEGAAGDRRWGVSCRSKRPREQSPAPEHECWPSPRVSSVCTGAGCPPSRGERSAQLEANERTTAERQWSQAGAPAGRQSSRREGGQLRPARQGPATLRKIRQLKAAVTYHVK